MNYVYYDSSGAPYDAVRPFVICAVSELPFLMLPLGRRVIRICTVSFLFCLSWPWSIFASVFRAHGAVFK